jgi:RNA polymerase sigma-70 factor (ECF subfamily)
MPQAAPHTEDLALARRCAAGEPEAAARLVEAYGPFLAGVLRRVWREGETEDLVAEVFLRLFEGKGALLAAYRGEAGLKAYLAVITRRVGLDALRRARVRGRGRIPLEDLLDRPAPEESEDGLTGLLACLPERDRRVLTLRYLEGLSYRDLAKALAAPPGSAAGWVARARERLRVLWIEQSDVRVKKTPSRATP